MKPWLQNQPKVEYLVNSNLNITIEENSDGWLRVRVTVACANGSAASTNTPLLFSLLNSSL